MGGFKLRKTDMSTLRSKQARSSKGVSEHQHFSDLKSQGDEPRVEYNMKSAAPKFNLRSGNGALPFKEMGSMKIEKVGRVGMEKLDTPKLSDKPIEATKTFEETSKEIKAEKKAAKKAKRKEIGDALVDAGAGLRNVGNNKSIIEGMEESKRSRESNQKTIANTDRDALRIDLNNQIKQLRINETELALDGENKLPETKKFVSQAELRKNILRE